MPPQQRDRRGSKTMNHRRCGSRSSSFFVPSFSFFFRSSSSETKLTRQGAACSGRMTVARSSNTVLYAQYRTLRRKKYVRSRLRIRSDQHTNKQQNGRNYIIPPWRPPTEPGKNPSHHPTPLSLPRKRDWASYNKFDNQEVTSIIWKWSTTGASNPVQ